MWQRRLPAGRMLGAAFAVIFAVAALSCARFAVAGGARPGRAGASTTLGGLRVTLIVGQWSYPRAALIVARVEMQNVSAKGLVLDTTCVKGGRPYVPAAIMAIGSDGSAVFPPALSGEGSQPCPPYAPRILEPGQRLVRRQYVILRSPIVQAVALLAAHHGAVIPVRARLVLTLTANDAPRLIVHTTPTLSAGVPQREESLLHYNQWVSCGQNGRLEAEEGSGWRQTALGRFVPLCFDSLEWQLVVARVNHSVAELDYRGK